MKKILSILFLLLVSVLSCGKATDKNLQEQLSNSIKSVIVQNIAGDLEIKKGDENKVIVMNIPIKIINKNDVVTLEPEENYKTKKEAKIVLIYNKNNPLDLKISNSVGTVSVEVYKNLNTVLDSQVGAVNIYGATKGSSFKIDSIVGDVNIYNSTYDEFKPEISDIVGFVNYVR